MKGIGLVLVLVLTFFSTSLVGAEEKKCFEKSAFIGTWEGFRVDDFFEDECPSKSLEIDVLATGGVLATVYGFEDPFVFEIKMAGEWKLDCDRVISKTTKINKIDISLDEEADLSDEEEEKANSQIPSITKVVQDKMESDPHFGEEQAELVIYLDAQYMMSKGPDGQIYVYKKK